MILGTIVLWAPDLSDFVLSITAFVLAIVIATKEVLMGLAGGIVRSTPGAVTIGDRIEAGGHGGEVVEITGVVLPPPAPEVRIRTTGLAELRVEMRLFCPCERAGDKEQAATLARLGATRG